VSELILMCGLPGAGKSTFVNNLLSTRTRLQVICADDIRLSMGHKFNLGIEPLVRAISETMVKAFLVRGLDVVVDETFTKVEYILPYRSLATDYGYKLTMYYLSTPKHTCLERRLTAEPSYPWEAIINRKLKQLEANYHDLIQAVDSFITV
jgi:predicted kinase